VEPDPYDGGLDNLYFCPIAFVTLTIVPVMIIWWVVAQLDTRRRRKAGIHTSRSRWHFLRCGPTAPLISAAVFVGGSSVWITRPDPETITPSIVFCLMMMGFAGLIALAISAVPWAVSTVLEMVFAARLRATSNLE
jgi:hypothetical protein